MQHLYTAGGSSSITTTTIGSPAVGGATTAAAARKLGEEAVEAVVAAVSGDAEGLAAEAADVLYHLLVLLAASGVSPDAVAARLEAREGVSGLQEKASRSPSPP